MCVPVGVLWTWLTHVMLAFIERWLSITLRCKLQNVYNIVIRVFYSKSEERLKSIAGAFGGGNSALRTNSEFTAFDVIVQLNRLMYLLWKLVQRVKSYCICCFDSNLLLVFLLSKKFPSCWFSLPFGSRLQIRCQSVSFVVLLVSIARTVVHLLSFSFKLEILIQALELRSFGGLLSLAMMLCW